MLNKAAQETEKREAVVIKKYANRRLYNTETSTYVTLEDLAAMVRSDRDFVVYDAKTGDDLTHSVLTQIIVEQEARAGGQTLLPVPFLRQLIRFYDDAVGKMVPSYLQFSLENLVKEQERFREQFAPLFQKNPFGAAGFEAMQAQTRKNMAMFEQALAMWAPFVTRPGGLPQMPMGGVPSPAKDGAASPSEPNASSDSSANQPASAATSDELASLKAEFARMQARIDKLTKGE
jgi:polyhydroxyalkanoate synthesis repressor PhaR